MEMNQNQDFKMNKKADVAVVLLVFMTVFLVGASLFIFYTNASKVEKEIDVNFLKKIYLDEIKMDFYIDEIMEKAVEDLEAGDNENKFMENFKDELSKYERKGIIPKIDKIKEQIREENVEIGEEFVSIKLSIRMESKSGNELIASHLYDKGFRKALNE